jgi:hypothetical protein
VYCIVVFLNSGLVPYERIEQKTDQAPIAPPNALYASVQRKILSRFGAKVIILEREIQGISDALNLK